MHCLRSLTAFVFMQVVGPIAVFVMFSSSFALAIDESACDKGWGVWGKNSLTCHCISTKRSITDETGAAKCRADHLRGWNTDIHSSDARELKCGGPPPINSNLQCPKQLLQQIVQSSTSSSVFWLVGAPDKECQSTLDQQFAKPEDLEHYLASSPKYSLGADPNLLSNTCLSDFSEFRAVGSPGKKLADHPAKQAIATYYYLSDRLNRGSQGTLESIASIDSILGKAPLNNVDCSDPHLKKAEQWCADFRKKNCSAQGGLDDLARESLDMVQIYDKADQEENQIKNHGDSLVGAGRAARFEMSSAQKTRVAEIENAKTAILSQYPWISGTEFRKYLNDHSASAFQKALGKANHPEYNFQVIHDALYSQLTRDREANLQRLNRFKRIGGCLNEALFQYDKCKDFDEVIGETPPLNEPDFVGKDAQCRWDVDLKKSDIDHRFSNITQGIVTTGAITVVTMGLGTAAAVGEMGLGEVVSNANTASKVIQSATALGRATNAARVLTGLDTAFVEDGIKNAVDTCKDTLIRLDRAANDASAGPSCPSKVDNARPGSPNASAKMTSDCTIAIAMSAANLLPLATPALRKLIRTSGDLSVASEDLANSGLAESVEKSIDESPKAITNTADFQTKGISLPTLRTQSKEPVVKTVGNDFKVVPENGGQSRVLRFESNQTDFPAVLPDRFGDHIPTLGELRDGYSFMGKDGNLWKFKSIDSKGIVEFTSGSKTMKWQSGYYSANSYKIQIPSAGARSSPHEIQVVIPTLKDGSQDVSTLKRIQNTISDLPQQGVDQLQQIRVHSFPNKWDSYWGAKYKSKWLPQFIYKAMFKSAATGGERVINLFPAGNFGDMANLFRHELGHVIASGRYGTTMPDAVWESAMRSDRKVVSEYAKNSNAEDFAETVMEYLRKDAGISDSTLFSPSHQKYAARFKILDQYFRVHPEEKRAVVDQLRNVKRVVVAGGLSGAAIFVGNEVRLFFTSDQN